jgi:hypothetical protein
MGLLVPPGVVTVTPTDPLPEGETAVTWVGETLVTAVADRVPKRTAVVPLRPVPVMVTSVPPPLDPWFGLIGVRNSTSLATQYIAEQFWGVRIRGRLDRVRAAARVHRPGGDVGGLATACTWRCRLAA